MGMRRTNLERQLKTLGWHPIGDVSSLGTRQWSNGRESMPVPATDEMILDSVAADILNAARGGTV